jgi:hypothetical protein
MFIVNGKKGFVTDISASAGGFLATPQTSSVT